MDDVRSHLLVKKGLHKKLKILSAETGISMKRLTENAIELLINKYQDKNKIMENNL